MALRKASSYSLKIVVPYTRVSKKKNRAYIKTVPPKKLVKFTMGTRGNYPHIMSIVSDNKRIQIRDNALEACRQYIHKILDTSFPGQYLFRVVPVPHHIQRENKMLTGAGADRMQTGMQLSFGKTVGRAAILREGEEIFHIEVMTPNAVQLVRKTIHQVKAKLPGKIKILYHEIKAVKA